jgi:hypothetical protein
LQELRVLRVSFTQPADEKNGAFDPSLALWNHQTPLEDGLEHGCAMAGDKWPGLFPAFYPGWQLCHYLPLMDKDGPSVSGITARFSQFGISGLLSDSNPPVLAGSRTCDGPALHFPLLGGGERIVSVWVGQPSRSGNLPFLLVSSMSCKRPFTERVIK